MARARSDLEQMLGGLAPRWQPSGWTSEVDAFDAIVGGVRTDERARAWLRRWAAEGYLSRSHVLRQFFMDDILAGGSVADLLHGSWEWWRGDIGSDDRDAGGRLEGDGARERDTAGRRGVRYVRIAGADDDGVAGGSQAGHGDDRGGRGPASDRARALAGRPVRVPCTCDRSRLAAQAPGAPPEPRHLTALRAQALAVVAKARAVLAASIEGAWRGEQVGVLGGIGEGPGGVGSTWLVRAPWQQAWRWTDCRAFPGSVRAAGRQGRGRMVGLGGEAAQLLCGLCGGYPLGHVDEWLQLHPLAPPDISRHAV